MKTMYAVIVLGLLMGMSEPAAADPEQAYQGGKAIKDTMTGNKDKVDDRDFEERMRALAREQGAKAGGAGKSESHDKQTTSGRNQSEQPRTDNPRRP